LKTHTLIGATTSVLIVGYLGVVNINSHILWLFALAFIFGFLALMSDFFHKFMTNKKG
jgi:hypothetical protein